MVLLFLFILLCIVFWVYVLRRIILKKDNKLVSRLVSFLCVTVTGMGLFLIGMYKYDSLGCMETDFYKVSDIHDNELEIVYLGKDTGIMFGMIDNSLNDNIVTGCKVYDEKVELYGGKELLGIIVKNIQIKERLEGGNE